MDRQHASIRNDGGREVLTLPNTSQDLLGDSKVSFQRSLVKAVWENLNAPCDPDLLYEQIRLDKRFRANFLVGDASPYRVIAEVVSGLNLIHNIDTEEFASSVKASFLKNLACEPWTPLHYCRAFNERAYDSLITPLNTNAPLALTLADNFTFRGDGGTPSYLLREDEVGIPLANGWITELAHHGDPAAPRLFKGIRTASLLSYSGSDSSETALQGLLQASALMALERYLPKDIQAILNGKKVLPLHLVSIDLQSYLFPRDQHALGYKIEGPLIDRKEKLLDSHRGKQSIELFLNGSMHRITVLFNPLPVNVPVYSGGFHLGIGFEKLREQVPVIQRYLSETEHRLAGMSSEVKNVSRHLADQIKEILSEDNFMLAEGDPYRLASRLALYGYSIGDIVHFHCRSGKDRTGFLDAEIKFLAARLDRSVGNSDPLSFDLFKELRKQWLTQNEQEFLFDLSTKSGNLVIQEFNAGLPGFKLNPVTGMVTDADPLVRRIGEDNWPLFRGFASYTDL